MHGQLLVVFWYSCMFSHLLYSDTHAWSATCCMLVHLHIFYSTNWCVYLQLYLWTFQPTLRANNQVLELKNNPWTLPFSFQKLTLKIIFLGNFLLLYLLFKFCDKIILFRDALYLQKTQGILSWVSDVSKTKQENSKTGLAFFIHRPHLCYKKNIYYIMY